MQMLDSSHKNIMDICNAKLAKIDAEMDRLKYLRHWLKDNIELLHTAENTGDGYIIMDCPATKYVIYSENEKLLTEKDRLKTINMFMYHVHEVQMMYLIKGAAIDSTIPTINLGWVMKEMDIKRLHLENDVTSDNPYIIDYPSKKCLYSIFQYPANLNMGDEQLTSAINAYKEKLINHMNEQGYTLDGDIMMIVIDAIGCMAQLLCCVPIK